jgi:hypothetical protein
VTVLIAWAIGIGFAVWVCRLLWKARRDAQLRKTIAAGMAGGVASESVEAAWANDASGWDGNDGGDGGGDGGD